MTNEVYTFRDPRVEAGLAPGRDCAIRALVIVGDLDYADTYNEACDRIAVWADAGRTKEARAWRASKRPDTPLRGSPTEVMYPWLAELGWHKVPTMGFGSGTVVHLDRDELPSGRLFLRVTGHITAMIDGTIVDRWNPNRGGTRCVYVVWSPDPIDPEWSEATTGTVARKVAEARARAWKKRQRQR